MGFNSDLLTKAIGSTVGAGVTAATNILTSQAQKKAAKDTQAISDYNRELTNNQTKVLREEAIENSLRMREDAVRKMGTARADAGASSLASDGSVAMREIDLSTRLESEILDEMRARLNQVNNLQRENSVRSMDGQEKANSLKTGSRSTLLSGFGSTVSQTADATSAWYKYSDALRQREQKDLGKI